MINLLFDCICVHLVVKANLHAKLNYATFKINYSEEKNIDLITFNDLLQLL